MSRVLTRQRIHRFLNSLDSRPSLVYTVLDLARMMTTNSPGRMNSKRAMTAASLAVILAILVGCTPGLRFSVEGCAPGMDGYSPPTAGISNSTWVSPDTLVVEGFVKTFCGGAAIAGDYRVNGNDLILVYSVKPGLVVTTCNCARKVVYRISNLPRQNYLISITPDK